MTPQGDTARAPRLGSQRSNDAASRPRSLPRTNGSTSGSHKRDDRRAAVLLALVVAALIAAGIDPYDRRVFLLEVVPWVSLLVALVAIHPSYRLTPLSQMAIAGLCLMLTLGAHYTYTRVPIGIDVRHWLGLERNPYDRIVHFA